MPYGPPLYGRIFGHIFCKYGEWGWSEFVKLSGHYSRDWSESVNVIGAISEPFARELR